jgi:predicted transposase YbfD/YdcC
MRLSHSTTRPTTVPAALSFAIPAAVTDPDHARPLAVGEGPGLLERLAILPDPRARRGRRHTLASVLALSAAAVLAGARSVAAIAEWAADAPGPVLAALGVRRDPLTRRWQVPGEATIRRVLAGVDADRLDRALGAWLAERLRPAGPRRRRVLAVDGKTLRGTASGGQDRPVQLLAVMDHADAAVLAQREVDAASNEISQFQPLLDGLDLAGVVVTADAMHTQRDHAGFLVDRGAAYLLVVKANQPALHAQLAGLPWRQIPVMDRTREHAHGRVELRTLKVATVAGLRAMPTSPPPCATTAATPPARSSSSAWQPHATRVTPTLPEPWLDMQPAGCLYYRQPACCMLGWRGWTRCSRRWPTPAAAGCWTA